MTAQLDRPPVLLHWHGYTWDGATERLESAPRGHRDHRTAGLEFRLSPLPPYETHGWLMKSARMITASWNDPGAVVRWLEAAIADLGTVARPDGDVIPLDVQLTLARELLASGSDVAWRFALPRGRLQEFAVVSCPRRALGADTPCPRPVGARHAPRYLAG